MHKEEIKKAIVWLRRHQNEQGQFVLEGSKNPALDHVLASFAMCEAYRLGANRVLKPSVDRARDHLVKNLQPGTELRGWYLLLNQCFRGAKIPVIDAALRTQGWTRSGESALGFSVESLEGRLLPVLDGRFSTASTDGAGVSGDDVPVNDGPSFRVYKDGVRAGFSEAEELVDLLLTANKVLANGGPGAVNCYFTTLAMQSVSDKHGLRWRELLQPHLAAQQNDQGVFRNSQKDADPKYDTALLVMALLARRSYQLGW